MSAAKKNFFGGFAPDCSSERRILVDKSQGLAKGFVAAGVQCVGGKPVAIVGQDAHASKALAFFSANS